MKLASSMRPAASAARQSSELPAKASIAQQRQDEHPQRRHAGNSAGSRGASDRILAGMDHTLDRLTIRDLIENWVVWRDAGDWERFRTVWHDDGG